MTVKELIEYLNGFPDDLQVVLSKDAEGNGFSRWSGDHSVGVFEGGEFTDASEWDGDRNALVLWPA